MMNLLVLLIQLYLTYISIVNTLTLSLPLKSKKISLFLILKSIGTVADFRQKWVYCKPTFSGVFTNFDSYIPFSNKYGLISSLLFRAFKLCSNFEIFHREIILLKDIFKSF